MTKHQRIACLLSVSLLAALALSALAGASIELELVNPVVALGEPFDVTARLSNIGAEALITTDEAFAAARLWPHLKLTRILPDGTEIPIVSDRPLLSPSPSSLWVDRGGVQVRVRPALAIAPGASVDVRIENLLRYFPLVDPGSYELALSYELPLYAGIFTDAAYGDTELVAADCVDEYSEATGRVDFVLALSEELTEEDVEWFRLARERFMGSRLAEDVIGALALPAEGPPAYVRACSWYWIGEAYQLFWADDQAAAAYEVVLSSFPDSPFAGYASVRLAEIEDSE